MSLETILVQNGSLANKPRADISVGKLYYDQLIDPLLQGLIPNSSAQADAENNFTIIQAALGGGGSIPFPAGLYYVSDPLIITESNTQLFGEGIDLTTIKAIPSFDGELLTIGSAGESISNVSIKSLTLDGNGINGVMLTGSCLFMINAQNCIVEEVKCYCPYQEGIIMTTSSGTSFGNLVKGCIIEYPVTAGIAVVANSVTDIYNCTFSDCMISYCGTNGVSVAGSNGVVFNAINIYRSNETGFLASQSINSLLSASRIDRSGTSGVDIYGATSFNVIGNIVQYSSQVDGTVAGIYLESTTTNCNISQNSIVEDNVDINDEVVGPNGVTYIPKTQKPGAGIAISSSTSNIIRGNFIASVLSTRISGASDYKNEVVDPSSTATISYDPLTRFTGGIGNAIRTSSASSIQMTFEDCFLLSSNNSVARTVIMPALPAAVAGWYCIIKDSSNTAGTKAITIESASLIDGSPTADISSNYGVKRLFTDGTTFYSW